MFLNTNVLNEGGCREKCSGSRKREMKEGKNPRSNQASHQAAPDVHSNSHWQNLRK